MTSQPITVDSIRQHYDRLSSYYRTLWGDHIHHGYWDKNQSPGQAQVALVEKLAERAEIRAGSRVLDVGCGLGASAIWLAHELKCSVLGLTISPAQLEMARARAIEEGLEERVRFQVEDANSLKYVELFDVVWVIECSEHLFDKAAFIRAAAAALRPGGVFALCAWLKSDGIQSGEYREIVDRVCRRMLCPSLASKSEYCAWMADAGFRVRTAEDITHAVSKTWDVCLKIPRLPMVRRILGAADPATLEFIRSFTDIADAYAQGAMSYGMFTANKVV
ncbi:MAG TPA: class I SAM-dependent methyltransferase [Terriglobia bacterium]|nr:class I SAM-dependent methyltransferase [Terriglobia bacterium]